MAWSRKVPPLDRPDFRITIEAWADAEHSRIEEYLAGFSNVSIARAAFDAAVRCYPKRYLTLRQGALVMGRYDPPSPD
jgi:hypothetical protein